MTALQAIRLDRNIPPRWVFDPVPARALSVDQAIAQMNAYANAGLVDIVTPAPDSSDPGGSRMTIGARIGGIQHSYLETSGITSRKTIDNLDPRFGVLLVRLDAMLENRGVTEVLDLGITHGSSNPDDVHNQGRAIDVGGLRGSDRSGPFDLRIFRDWGQRPDLGVGVYRLSASDPGFDLFASIYALGTQEGADRSTHPEWTPPTQIGESSYLITPDHPNADLRSAHKNHIHLQLGRTIGAEP